MTAAEYRALSQEKPSKYKNKPTTVGGIRFHSKKEALRWIALKDMERKGEISELERQMPFIFMVNCTHVCTLVIDFTYMENGKRIAEDSKGYQTAESKLKMKLAAALYPRIEWRLS